MKLCSRNRSTASAVYRDSELSVIMKAHSTFRGKPIAPGALIEQVFAIFVRGNCGRAFINVFSLS